MPNEKTTNPTPKPEKSTYEKMQQGQHTEVKDGTSPSQNTQPKEQPSTIASLEKEKAKLIKELAEAKKMVHDEKLRALAEIQNIQSRYQRQAENDKSYAISHFAKDLLELGDALEQGIRASQNDAQTQGLEMIWKVFISTLQKNNIEVLNPIGQPYDPHLHEAMVMQPTDEVTPNTVLQVIQTGYQLNKLQGRLLRAARVIVSQKKDEKNES